LILGIQTDDMVYSDTVCKIAFDNALRSLFQRILFDLDEISFFFFPENHLQSFRSRAAEVAAEQETTDRAAAEANDVLHHCFGTCEAVDVQMEHVLSFGVFDVC